MVSYVQYSLLFSNSTITVVCSTEETLQGRRWLMHEMCLDSTKKLDDIKEWTNAKDYNELKRSAEIRTTGRTSHVYLLHKNKTRRFNYACTICRLSPCRYMTLRVFLWAF